MKKKLLSINISKLGLNFYRMRRKTPGFIHGVYGANL